MKYTESHEWIKVLDNIGIVGITAYAQKELGDIVYVELPKIGKKVRAGEEVAVLESTKAAADVYSPVSGIILEVNEALRKDSSLINSSSEDNGWLFKIELETPDEINKLMENFEYQNMIGKNS